MFIEDFILKHTPKTLERELAKNKVGKLYAFGSSVMTGSPRDIDLLIEIDETDPIKKGDSLISIWDFLEKYFGKKVDLLTENTIKNPVLKSSIDSTKKLIYAKGQYQIST